MKVFIPLWTVLSRWFPVCSRGRAIALWGAWWIQAEWLWLLGTTNCWLHVRPLAPCHPRQWRQWLLHIQGV